MAGRESTERRDWTYSRVEYVRTWHEHDTNYKQLNISKCEEKGPGHQELNL